MAVDDLDVIRVETGRIGATRTVINAALVPQLKIAQIDPGSHALDGINVVAHADAPRAVAVPVAAVNPTPGFRVQFAAFVEPLMDNVFEMFFSYVALAKKDNRTIFHHAHKRAFPGLPLGRITLSLF